MSSVQPLFRDRAEAGKMLVGRLKAVGVDFDTLVLALPTGGVLVGFEIAQALSAELDVMAVRKLGAPGQGELAMGAIAPGGIHVLNHALLTELRVSATDIDHAMAREQEEIKRRERLYRAGRPALSPNARVVVLVDDGLATGATMLAAARAVRAQQPKRIILAVPVASRVAYEELRQHVDEIGCAEIPEPFDAVGPWYENFSQVSDADVRALLGRASHEHIA